jgi:hypothetical protein
MTSTPTDIPFKYLKSPIYPGAYLIDGGNGSYPIFCSIKDFTDHRIWMDNKDNSYLVMPGYRLVVYTSTSYGGDYTDADNTFGEVILYKASSNPDEGKSCKLYFNYTSAKPNEITVSGIS